MVENRMRNVAVLVAACILALALELPTSGAQAQSPDRPTAQGQSQKPIPKLAWAPKPATPAPYAAPNRPIWRLSDLLAKHKGEQDWTETIVNTPHFIGQYISMGQGEKTKTVFYADDRVFWVIESGSIRFTIEGQPPFVASKGFLVQVPFRTPYSMETVGDTPSLRFEIRPSGQAPIYPAAETPTPIPGVAYVKATYTGKGSYDAVNRPYLDFYKDVAPHGATTRRFVEDDHTGFGLIRGPAVQTPPPTDFGHFHESFDEFWFVLEGTLDVLIEGEPLIHAHEGDIAMAPTGRWHRLTNGGTGMSTRLPVIARTGAAEPVSQGNLHFFQPDAAKGD
jgi:mannose-6-phosphate isomerase-like protein (cupin superfamily)